MTRQPRVLALFPAIFLILLAGPGAFAQPPAAGAAAAPSRPQGPCDIYAAAGDPCVAAHSTTRALYAAYNGPLYRVVRQSDGKSLDIGVVRPSASPAPNAGGYADAAAQDAFCANTYCWITVIYDQSPNHNNLTQAPRGGFSGPALGGFNNVPLAAMAPVTVLGHKVYGVFIEPGMGLRDDDPKGTAVDDQAEGEYWVVNGHHFNSGCCFDYGNAEIDSRDDQAGTMETAYFGNAPWWYHGPMPGPWIMTDQENNLVGCVNPDGSKFCAQLPSITWRFVTAMAEGEPHHWASLGGDAQRGRLSVMFSGPRVDSLYDPMRKQGAILLGNGGDNSNGSQGTFYEGAMTAAGTFPSLATEQRVQANIVAAGYAAAPLRLASADADAAAPRPGPGLRTFSPGSSRDLTLTFTNTTLAPVANLTLSLAPPRSGWRTAVRDGMGRAKTFQGPIAPGASVSATFRVTSGPRAWDGDLVGRARWRDAASGDTRSASAIERVRNAAPVKINEFRISSGPPTNSTDSFIELYNAGDRAVDLSNWTLTEHPSRRAIFSRLRIPAGTRLAAGGFYLLGLSDSGLAAPARAGAVTIYVRNAAGMSAGDSLQIGGGPRRETRAIARLGAAAGDATTVWQPLPDGPVITIPAGATNVPVTSVAGFGVGEKIALGYGATYPTVPGRRERFELATVTAVGKPGTQAYLAADARAGASNIKVTSAADISVGDKIRLDIASVRHGVETVTVTRVGGAAIRAELASTASAGATEILVRGGRGLAAGDEVLVGTPANRETVTISSVAPGGPPSPAAARGPREMRVEFTPALRQTHAAGQEVVDPGAGLDLAAPLRFNHAANLPFSDRGTGISFTPATAHAHISNEPVLPLGGGITLDRPLSRDHGANAVVRDAAVTTAGYQGRPAPNQWFGGPTLTTRSPLFGRMITLRAGSIVLRDAAGHVVDSLNYGGLVDPWAAEGNQAVSGFGADGCYVAAPGPEFGFGPFGPPAAANVSTGRFPDGRDTDSNCADFHTSPASALAMAAAAGATNIKVVSVGGFAAGQTIRVDGGANLETAVLAQVGSAGGTTLRAAAAVGATALSVADAAGFNPRQTITIGDAANQESAVIASVTRFPRAVLTLSAPLKSSHAADEPVAGGGLTLTAPLTLGHDRGAPITGNAATPGAPNHYRTAGN